MVQICRTVAGIREVVTQERSYGSRVALVPTMGALHAGHAALMEEAAKHAEMVVVSIFVNPRQFGPNEDFEAYPRDLDKDVALCGKHGVAYVYAPTVEEIYSKGMATNISVTGLTEGLCGASRPGHFDGVATVVTKLLLQVGPDVALFGEKDFQQLQMIYRLVVDLNIPVEIIGVPTSREKDGLARSSRNAYLTPGERKIAPALYQQLLVCAEEIRAGKNIAATLEEARQELLAAGFQSVDYIECCRVSDLKPLVKLPKNKGVRLLAAARLGRARLIDNVPV